MELLNSHSEWNSQKFKGISFRNDHLSQVEFNTCAFIKCVFSETIFQKCAFHDCTFHNCDLNLVNLKDCVFSNTRFVESQIIGVDWTETALPRSKFIKPVDFSGCVINHSTFVGLNLKKIGLTKCIAQDVDFTAR
jgi:fluoroquinolone resistance protein